MRELLSESLRGWGDKTVVKQTKKQTNKSNKGMLLKLYQWVEFLGKQHSYKARHLV